MFVVNRQSVMVFMIAMFGFVLFRIVFANMLRVITQTNEASSYSNVLPPEHVPRVVEEDDGIDWNQSFEL